MPYNQPSNGPDYVNIWFGFKILQIVAKIYAWAMLIAIFSTWAILKAIFPAYSDVILWVSIGLGAFGVPVLFVLMSRRGQRRRAQSLRDWAPAGALRNPPMPWLDDQGNRLWKRVGDEWQRTTVLQRDK